VVDAYQRKDLEPPRTEKGRVSTARLTLEESGDPVLEELATLANPSKLLSTYVPALLRGTKVPINARYNVLVASGRTSCGSPNLQNPPREGGVREAFVPRPGFLFASVDYDTLELRTLAQALLDMKRQVLSFTTVDARQIPADHTTAIRDVFQVAPDDTLQRFRWGPSLAPNGHRHQGTLWCTVWYSNGGGQVAETYWLTAAGEIVERLRRQ
jgi:hypothetical protein